VDRDRHPDLNIWVLALRHAQVAVNAPHTRGDEQHPGHVSRLDKEAGGVMRFADDLVVAAML
jgi:23S rRNA-/tRNA-specific pseudouridylate synthase